MGANNDTNVRNKGVMVLGGQITRYRSLVAGLISYISKYLIAVDYEVSQYYEDNDVIIVVRIKNVADKIQAGG